MKLLELIVIIILKDTDARIYDKTIKNRCGIATIVDEYIYKTSC
jgi:hypothetical protein